MDSTYDTHTDSHHENPFEIPTSSPFKCTIPITPVSNENISPSLPDDTAKEPLRAKESPKRHTPFSAPWVAARLKDSPLRAISILRTWTHPNRHREVNDETVMDINKLPNNQAIEALNDLKKPHVFI
jgi:hypothetical protein